MSSQDDDEDENKDRELDELLSELRVVLPGVTVLFAFLLTLPFTARFDNLATLQRAAYFVAFAAGAISLVLLTGETAYHRLVGKPYDKGRMVKTAARQCTGGLALLGIALAAVVLLVTDLIYDRLFAMVATAIIVALAVVTWGVLPLRRRH